jgi:hypothetical protein
MVMRSVPSSPGIRGQQLYSASDQADTIFIHCAGLTIYGNIQPDRLAHFTGLESDGLLQRFNPIVCGPAGVARPNIRTPATSAYDAVLRRLSRLEDTRYATCEEGSALIRETERLGTEFASLADFGRGFQGYCAKLHGTHSRIPSSFTSWMILMSRRSRRRPLSALAG